MNTSLPAGQTVAINGMQMYYVIVGQGEPLLLLHGFMGVSLDWAPFTHDLASEYQLIIPDLRGHGRSTNPLTEFTHRQAALDVWALLDHLHIERFKAIGFSGGGNVLLHLATQHPSRVEAMVLLGAASYYPQQARTFMRQMTVEGRRDEEWPLMRQRHQQGDEQVQALWRQAKAMKDNYDDMNFTPPYLSTITARTLLVYGDRDELVPVQIALEMYTALPHSYLWIIPNAGHAAIFSRLSEPWGLRPFIQAVLPFLRGEWEGG
jgi:pimeloyl-ACP methyl ester carboxylesterase